MYLVTTSEQPGSGSAPAQLDRPNGIQAATLWALIGVVCLSLITYSWSRWFFGGHAEPIDPGPTPIPTWQTIVLRANEVISVVGTIVVVYLVIWRTWRREHRLSFDGMMVIGCFTVFMLLDPALNYSRYWFSYHSGFVNVGCPQCFLPGWQSDQNFPEPILWAWGFYVMALFPAAVVCSIWMRKLKQRWPKLKGPALFGITWIGAIGIDLAIEIPWSRTGVYAIGGAFPDWSIGAGHYYQFPVYEAVLGSLWFVALGALRYYKNDKGESFAERGIQNVKTTERRKTGIRLLGIIAACNVLTLAYYIPAYVLAVHSADWPDDITTRSYYVSQCGPDNSTCPGEDGPVPVRGAEPNGP